MISCRKKEVDEIVMRFVNESDEPESEPEPKKDEKVEEKSNGKEKNGASVESDELSDDSGSESSDFEAVSLNPVLCLLILGFRKVSHFDRGACTQLNILSNNETRKLFCTE